MFPNIDILKFVNCKVFLIHGKLDDMICIKHAHENAKSIKNSFNHLWIDDAYHNDVK